MLENLQLVESLTKDMSKGVGRLISKPALLEQMDEASINTLQDKIRDYSPKSEIGRASRDQALTMIANRLGGVSTPESEVSVTSMIENRTCVLRVEVPQPGFNKCISTKAFVEKTKDPNAPVLMTDVEEEGMPAGFEYGRHTVVQKLFGRQYLKPLISQRQEFIGWLKRKAVPSSLMSNDCYLVPHALINSVIEKIEELTAERSALLDEFEAKYQEAQDDAREKLGPHFDASRYPDFSEIRDKFTMLFRWQDVNPAAALKTINKAAYEKEVQNGRLDWETTFEDIRDGLRAGFADLITGFAESMGNDEDGKPRVFHASKVEKLKDFLTTFEARDLTDDVELAALASQAKDLISSVDPTLLRKDLDLRSKIAQSFVEIKKKAGDMVVTRTRKVQFDD